MGLNNLQKMNLSYNQLTELKDNSFINLNNLQVLYLDINQLTELKENTFIGLNNSAKVISGWESIDRKKSIIFGFNEKP